MQVAVDAAEQGWSCRTIKVYLLLSEAAYFRVFRFVAFQVGILFPASVAATVADEMDVRLVLAPVFGRGATEQAAVRQEQHLTPGDQKELGVRSSHALQDAFLAYLAFLYVHDVDDGVAEGDHVDLVIARGRLSQLLDRVSLHLLRVWRHKHAKHDATFRLLRMLLRVALEAFYEVRFVAFRQELVVVVLSCSNHQRHSADVYLRFFPASRRRVRVQHSIDDVLNFWRWPNQAIHHPVVRKVLYEKNDALLQV